MTFKTFQIQCTYLFFFQSLVIKSASRVKLVKGKEIAKKKPKVNMADLSVKCLFEF